MPYQWTAITLNPTTGEETDLSRIVNRQTSTYHPTAHGKSKQSTQFLSFRADATIGDIHEGWPWQAGYRDPATRYWDGSQARFCGQVGRQTGRAGNIRHYIDQTLDTWETTFGDTALLHWPNNDFLSVYPVGYSIANWLVGTSPYLGLVRAGYDATKVDFGGVDPVFTTLILDATNLPAIGKSVVPGVGQFCYLQDALDTMIAVANFTQNGMDPVAFFEPIISPTDPTQIIPRFRFVDRNAVGSTPVATFSVTPTGDEWPIEQPMTHDRDPRPAKQRIIVVGKGGDPTIAGTPLVYVDYTVPAHVTAYATWLHATPGRALILVDERINTLITARKIALAIESKIYGPEGRITFRTARPTQAGEVVRVHIPQEGQDYARFVVADSQAVAGTVGRPLYQITVGAPAPDLRSIVDNAVRGTSNDLPLVARKALAAGLGAPSTPKYRQALDANPHTTAQNTTTPRDKTIVAHRIKGSARLPTGATTAPAANLWEVEAAAGTDKTLVSPDGRPHPQTFPLAFTADGTTDPYISHWDMDLAAIRLKGAGSVTLNRNGVAVAGPVSGTGLHLFAAIHYAVGGPDDWSLTVSGTSGPLSVIVSEA